MRKEIWKDVIEYEGHYEVSSFGRVRSRNKTVSTKWGTRNTRSKILKQPEGCGPGYKTVTLSKFGLPTSFTVHRLVLDAFVCIRPKGMEACHNDGDASNNKISNLRWDTREANRTDTEKMGRTAKGEKNGNAKLTNEERKEIYKLKGILPINRIAHLYNVWPSTISNVFTGKEIPF